MAKRKEKQRRKKLFLVESIMRDQTVTHVYIKKGGSYYRSNSCGYTGQRLHAGIFPKSEIKRHLGCNELEFIPVDNQVHNDFLRKEIAALQNRMIPAAREYVKEIISDEEIDRVHGCANFGGMKKRDVVNYGVLKCAAGYHQGSTSEAIIRAHGLINKQHDLTPKGKVYLWEAFGWDGF
ncbi:MAG: hypothetical protein D3910_06980 [Candidatus Electrothrix sp. ATG2]|nr:hypothetical protein [Candidatus Electrothrix sp. ATG2]